MSPDELRAHSFAVVEKLPASRATGLGFNERPPDSPEATAQWIARMSEDAAADVAHGSRLGPGKITSEAIRCSEEQTMLRAGEVGGDDGVATGKDSMEGPLWEAEERATDPAIQSSVSWLLCCHRLSPPHISPRVASSDGAPPSSMAAPTSEQHVLLHVRSDASPLLGAPTGARQTCL